MGQRNSRAAPVCRYCEGDPDYNPRANFDPTNLCGDDPNLQTMGQDDLDVVLFYFGLPSTGSIRATMTWDAENRLASWQALVPTTGSKRLKFKYDYMGRRVEKAVYVWDPNLGDGGDWPGSPNSVRRYVWRDWLRLMELDGSNNVLRRWTWGRDLSGLTGSMGVSPVDGAGGIGGLLAVHDANETPGDPNDDFKYVYFYDANGNVGQVVDLAAADPNNTIKAKYEYDAYGNVTSSGGAYATANVFRFSTKPWDDETGMGDWGRRYYDARFGRWVSRDPLGAVGGKNLYVYCRNSAPRTLDAHGLLSLPDELKCGDPRASEEPCPGLAAAIQANQAEIGALERRGCGVAILCNGPGCATGGAAAHNPDAPPPWVSPPGGVISVCGSVSAGILRHELVHALQLCGKPGGPGGPAGPPDPEHINENACREIQAEACSGKTTAADRDWLIASCVGSVWNLCWRNPRECKGSYRTPEPDPTSREWDWVVRHCEAAVDREECRRCPEF